MASICFGLTAKIIQSEDFTASSLEEVALKPFSYNSARADEFLRVNVISLTLKFPDSTNPWAIDNPRFPAPMMAIFGWEICIKNTC
jgi:hypothetical protein